MISATTRAPMAEEAVLGLRRVMRGRLCCKDSPKILRYQGREVARDGRALDVRGLLTGFPARYGLPTDGGTRRSQRRPRPRHDRLRRSRFDRVARAALARPPCNAGRGRAAGSAQSSPLNRAGRCTMGTDDVHGA
jgi:hypothetical protein